MLLIFLDVSSPARPNHENIQIYLRSLYTMDYNGTYTILYCTYCHDKYMIPFQIVMYDMHAKISSYRCGCVYILYMNVFCTMMCSLF